MPFGRRVMPQPQGLLPTPPISHGGFPGAGLMPVPQANQGLLGDPSQIMGMVGQFQQIQANRAATQQKAQQQKARQAYVATLPPAQQAAAAAFPGAAGQAAFRAPQKAQVVPPGGVLYRDGKQIGSAPFKPAKPTNLQEKIDALVKADIPVKAARRIAAGLYAVVTHPNTGLAQIIRKDTGKIVYGGDVAARAADVTGATPQHTSMPADANYPGALGFEGAFSSLANTLFDAFGGGLPAPQNEKATQAFENLQVTTQTALQAAIPGRPSTYLLEALKKLTITPGSLLMGEGRARVRLSQTQGLMQEKINHIDNKILSNPHLYSRSDISDARTNREDLQFLLKQYDTVIESFDKSTRGGTTEADEAELDKMRRKYAQ